MVVSLNRGSQNKPPNTIILIIGTPKRVPLLLGNPHMIMVSVDASQQLSETLITEAVGSLQCIIIIMIKT